jgi:hypothetical protein
MVPNELDDAPEKIPTVNSPEFQMTACVICSLLAVYHPEGCFRVLSSCSTGDNQIVEF